MEFLLAVGWSGRPIQMESALSLLMWWCVLFLFPKEPWLLSWSVGLVDCAILSNFLYWHVLSLTVFTLWVATSVLQWAFFHCLQPLNKRKSCHSVAPIAKEIWLPTHPRNFGNHVTVHPPPSRSHIYVVVSRLSKPSIRWPVSPDRIAGSGVDPSRLRLVIFF